MGLNLVDYLLYEPENTGILWIKFNRPERMNALIGSSEENGTVAKVGEYMRAGDDDPNVRVIVLTGVGKGFCSGADMRRDTPDALKGENFIGNRGVNEGPDAARERFFHGFTKLHRDISQIRKPTTAMINGPAVGSGMGHRGLAGSSAYSCSKAGLWMLTRVLAMELWEDRISVNELIPGPVSTEMNPARLDGSSSLGASEWAKAPDDVVPLALFLATQPDVGPTAQSFSLMRRDA